jgi:hypothetical protein
MGYARADSRSRLRCRTGRGRTQRTIIMLAVYGVTIAFGLSDKSGTFSSDHSRDRRHGSDTEPSDRTVPPAPPPNVRITLSVPIADSTRYPLFYLLPGSREAPLDGHGLQHLPLRLDEVEVGSICRPEHRQSGSQGCSCAIQTLGEDWKTMERPVMAHNCWRAVAPPCLAGHASGFALRRAKTMARPSTFAEGFRDVDGKARRRARQWPETPLRDRPPRTPHQRGNLGVGRNGRASG